MKFLPDQPPASVSGQCIQGGPQGPFVRSGRPPVDSRRPRQFTCRGALGWTAQQWDTLSPTQKADWDALSSSGTSGLAKSAGRAVVAALRAPVPAPIPPAAAAPSFVLASALAWVSGALVVTVGAVTNGPDRFDVWCGEPRPGGDYSFVRYVIGGYRLAPVVGDYDITADYVAAFGLPPSGSWISVHLDASIDGILGVPGNPANVQTP